MVYQNFAQCSTQKNLVRVSIAKIDDSDALYLLRVCVFVDGNLVQDSATVLSKSTLLGDDGRACLAETFCFDGWLADFGSNLFAELVKAHPALSLRPQHKLADIASGVIDKSWIQQSALPRKRPFLNLNDYGALVRLSPGCEPVDCWIRRDKGDKVVIVLDGSTCELEISRRQIESVYIPYYGDDVAITVGFFYKNVLLQTADYWESDDAVTSRIDWLYELTAQVASNSELDISDIGVRFFYCTSQDEVQEQHGEDK